MSHSFTLDLLPVCKAVLHACKYPHAAVNGVLLGTRPDSASAEAPIRVQEAVPLFHTNLNLAPMLEAALLQVENAFRRLDIVGYYHGNELLHSNQPEGVGLQIFQKICDNCGPCVYAQVDNSAIGRDCQRLPLQFFARKDQQLRLELLTSKQATVVAEEESLAKLSALLQQRAYRGIVDFDNYLDDIRQDWTNRFLRSELQQLV